MQALFAVAVLAVLLLAVLAVLLLAVLALLAGARKSVIVALGQRHLQGASSQVQGGLLRLSNDVYRPYMTCFLPKVRAL